MGFGLIVKSLPRALVIVNFWLFRVLVCIQTFHTQHMERMWVLLADSTDFIDSVWLCCLITLELKGLSFDLSGIDSATCVAFWHEHWLAADEVFLSVLKLDAFPLSCIARLVCLVFLVEEFSHLPASKMRIVPNIARIVIIREMCLLIFNDFIVHCKLQFFFSCHRCLPLFFI